MFMKLRVLALLPALLLPLPLMANTTYTYTGNSFNTVSGPYTTSDSVSGYFTVATPLADNITSFSPFTPLTFSFTDGVQTYTNASTLSSSSFLVKTDASGDIINWAIAINGSPLNFILTEDAPGSYGVIDTGIAENDSVDGQISNDPGTWVESGVPVTPSPVPEPGTLALAGTGALGMMGALRRRLRRD
jgi:hypothetical protein